MKARLLRKLLNDTKYAISNHDSYIAVGSPLCHDLISVDKNTLYVKYALDTWNERRKALRHNDELLFIWDKLHELMVNGQLRDIINGKDEIENPLPVFTVEDGKLKESVTDKYGWPNTDDDGVCMYENTHFDNKEEALEYGISEYEAAKQMYQDRLQELKKEIEKVENNIYKYTQYVSDLRLQLPLAKKLTP